MPKHSACRLSELRLRPYTRTRRTCNAFEKNKGDTKDNSNRSRSDTCLLRSGTSKACASQCIVAKLSSLALPASQWARRQDWQTARRETYHHLEHHRLPVTAIAASHPCIHQSISLCLCLCPCLCVCGFSWVNCKSSLQGEFWWQTECERAEIHPFVRNRQQKRKRITDHHQHPLSSQSYLKSHYRITTVHWGRSLVVSSCVCILSTCRPSIQCLTAVKWRCKMSFKDITLNDGGGPQVSLPNTIFSGVPARLTCLLHDPSVTRDWRENWYWS